MCHQTSPKFAYHLCNESETTSKIPYTLRAGAINASCRLGIQLEAKYNKQHLLSRVTLLLMPELSSGRFKGKTVRETRNVPIRPSQERGTNSGLGINFHSLFRHPESRSSKNLQVTAGDRYDLVSFPW